MAPSCRKWVCPLCLRSLLDPGISDPATDFSYGTCGLWQLLPSTLQASPPGGWRGPKAIRGTQVGLQGAKEDQARKGLLHSVGLVCPESACHSSHCPLNVWQTRLGGSHLG